MIYELPETLEQKESVAADVDPRSLLGSRLTGSRLSSVAEMDISVQYPADVPQSPGVMYLRLLPPTSCRIDRSSNHSSARTSNHILNNSHVNRDW